MKRDDIQIYILGHEPIDYGYWDNSLYTPLQVGADFNPPFTDLRDNTGKNIGKWNPVFAEATGIYWAAYNSPDTLKYIGNCQYRRRIEFDENIDFDKLFENVDAICAEPIKLDISVKEQFALIHGKKDIEALKWAVKKLYPEYMDSWEKYIENSKILFYSSGFIMKREDYLRYAEFFSSIIFETLNILGLHSCEDVEKYAADEINAGNKLNQNGQKPKKSIIKYQRQLGGFMQERLSTLFIFHNFKNVALVPYKKYEGV